MDKNSALEILYFGPNFHILGIFFLRNTTEICVLLINFENEKHVFL